MVSRALADAGPEEFIVHTGQHYDEDMSRVFFDEMGVPEPNANLEVGSGTHAHQTGLTMMRLEPVCVGESPDVVLVYGDTNATLAGAVVAAKLKMCLAHVEAGLRSFDRTMPEEVNRVLTDQLSTHLFCPTEVAVRNLAKEGITNGVHNVGDVMFDAVRHFGEMAEERSTILDRLGVKEKGFVLLTIHRDFNTDNYENLAGIMKGVMRSGETVVFPAHPRVRKQLESFGIASVLQQSGMHLVPPVGYLDMLKLERSSKLILTDSGGVQKEAFFCAVPCVTVRPCTEWVETVSSGWNRLVSADADQIARAISQVDIPLETPVGIFGDGKSAELVASHIESRN